MTGFGQLLAHPAIQPLGWALIHFLWQGSTVAALLAAALWLLRHRTARARYLAACAALLAMAAAPAFTLLALSVPPGHTPPPSDRAMTIVVTTHGSLFGSSSRPSPAHAAATSPEQPRARRSHHLSFAGYPIAAPFADPERFLPTLVATWLIGVLALSLRLLGSWIVVQRLPHRHARPISGELAARAEELARRLGIHRPVRLLESTQVQVPLALGWLRAAILVPASAISGMPPTQLEALLAHELAHIRRHDYLVNLLQTAVETVLFYHPAVWWVSHQIRVEREHCSDDLAVLALGDRLTYARALTALETLRSAPAPLALAGSGGHLLARIRRILGLPPEQTAMAPAWLGGTMVITLLLAATALLRVSAADPPRPPVQCSRVTAARRSAHPKPPLRIIRAARRLALIRAHQHSAMPRPARRGSAASPHLALSHPPGAGVASTSTALYRVNTSLYRVNPCPTGPRSSRVKLASVGPKPRVRLTSNKPAGGKPPAPSGVIQRVPGQHVEDVAVLDLRGVPAKQVAQIQSLKDVGVLVLDPNNRGALRASMEDVGATVVAGPELKVSVEPFLEISRAALEAMPAKQKLLLVGVVVFKPDVPPALVSEKFESLQVTGVLLASEAVRGTLLGRMQITGATVPIPDNAGPTVPSLGENKVTPEYLSRLQDNSIYVNVGETEITPEVTEEMLARKIATYCNIGHTAARAPLVTLLKSRCPTNLGQFEETQPAAK